MLILDNSFTNFEETKFNIKYEKILIEDYQPNKNFIDPFVTFDTLAKDKYSYVTYFPNHRYMYYFTENLKEYFSDLEDYEKCAYIQNYLKELVEEGPKSISEAVTIRAEAFRKMMLLNPNIATAKNKRNLDVSALNLYKYSADHVIDNLLLWHSEAHITKEYLDMGYQHPQLMAFDLIKKSIKISYKIYDEL